MKNVATGILCSVLCALTACGGSGSSSGSKPKSSSSVAVSSSSVAVSSVAPSSTPASSVASSEVASSIVSSSSVSSSVESLSSSSSSSSSSAPVAQVGMFIDSAVAGVKYETTPGAFTGYTSATGEYQFAEGDKVVFSIGDLKFPEVTAKGVVTPVDIAESADPANAERIKTNIAALLQSLDIDGNPDNGISIDYDTAKTTAVAVEFNQPYADFAASPAVTDLVANSGSTTTTLVSESDAKAHLDGSLAKLLVGTWYVEGADYKYLLFVLDSGRYAALDFSEGDGSALELGSYAWNQTTGVVSVTNVERTDGNTLDIYPPMADGNILELDGNTLTLSEEGGETFVATRLVDSVASPLKGGWSIEGEVFFAFTDTHYFMGQFSEPDDNGQPGVEMGTYTYNSQTKAITYSTLDDNNLQWGLSHPCAVLNHEQSNDFACGPEGRNIVQTFTVTGDTLTFISEADTIANNGDEDEVMFERVNGLPDGDIHLKLNVKLTLTAYEQGQFFEYDNGVLATMQCDRVDSPNYNAAEYQLGYVEEYNESWVLGGMEERPTWVTNLPATYNPATGVLTFDLDEPLKPIPGYPGFSERWEGVFTATYNPGSDTVIEGTLTEVNHLSWIHNDSVSSCTSTYAVEATLR